jgi:hypothetical protein
MQYCRDFGWLESEWSWWVSICQLVHIILTNGGPPEADHDIKPNLARFCSPS